MTNYAALVAITLSVFCAIPAFADPAPVEARSPGDMTPEERIAMMKTASKYDNCIYSQAIAKVGEYPDIRHAADFAMGACKDKLEDLQKSITDMGFGTDFATAFTQRVRNRAARNILPELAIRKAGG